jgi:NADH-quinone oxidoreductase subunit J
MEIIFYIHAVLAIAAMAVAMVIRHTVHALLAMIGSLLCLAVAMYVLAAPVAAALEVIVYAGAIMVLFAFAIMLLQIPAPQAVRKERFAKSAILKAAIIFAVFWGELSFVLGVPLSSPSATVVGITDLAVGLFAEHGFLVELASMLLLAGLAAAIYVGQSFMAHARSVPEESV